MPAILRFVLSTLLVFGALPALAQADYPTHPVRIIIPYPAGGSTDIIARPLAERLSKSLGQQFVVENRGGAGGMIGAEALAKSAPDGYTIMISPQTPLVVLPSFRKANYDPVRDFIPIGRMTEQVGGLAVHTSLGVKTLAEFVALPKRRPGEISFVSAGPGTVTHLRGELLKLMAGIDLLHVPYKGNGEALPDLLAGNTHAMFEAVVLPYVKAGRLTLLCIVSDERHPDFPDTPTIKEAGYPDYDAPLWFGAYAPRGTPQPILDKLVREIARIHDDAEFRERQMSFGMRVYPKAETPEEIAKRMAAQAVVFADIIKKAGITAE